ncbi:hypothetical protein SGRA_3779 [Saprospira grandis str. Lewin]|uniref:Uncharacterized protein n=1 Tax=Saprospira grandis (strain Lewin) TaxID=984262 RepID=H6L8D1_SAPGL|nr:hypothetical protein SGRA_3779 [Saprospira grandis str. Lewin]
MWEGGIMFSGPAAFKLQANCWSGVGSAVPKLAVGFNLQPMAEGHSA